MPESRSTRRLALFRRLTQFVLQERRQINVLSIAAAIIMAEAIVGFARAIGGAVAMPFLIAIYSKGAREPVFTREFTLASAVQTAAGAIVNLALAAIALYLIARWSQPSAQAETPNDDQ